MYPDLELHVTCAAAEFRAAAAAESEAAQAAHRASAEHYVRLIQARGDEVAVGIWKRRATMAANRS